MSAFLLNPNKKRMNCSGLVVPKVQPRIHNGLMVVGVHKVSKAVRKNAVLKTVKKDQNFQATRTDWVIISYSSMLATMTQ